MVHLYRHVILHAHRNVYVLFISISMYVRVYNIIIHVYTFIVTYVGGSKAPRIL